MKIKRGDVWLVDFGPPENDNDHLQHSIRPVVIVSNNRANEHSMVLHAVPLTGRTNKKRYLPTHVFINGYQAEGLTRHSLALCEQLCSIRYGDLMERKGKLSAFQMLKITLGMQVQLLVFRDCTLNAIEAESYRKNIGSQKSCTQERYEELKDFFGTIVLQTNLDKPANEVFVGYKKRWGVETFFNSFKNTLNYKAFYEQDYYKLEDACV